MERRGAPMLNHVLQHTLRGLCDAQWVYAVFWRILPRNYPPPKWENEGGVMDRSKSNKRNWILVWEDGFCDFPACSSAKEANTGNRYGNHAFNHADEPIETAMHPELFFKMSHEIYNFGEGLMGKVAADNSHKWVYREPLEHEISFLSPWHGSLDPHPRTWEAQFKAGIQTIAVISVREGLIQLGSTKKVVEDLNFVIMMQRKFNYLQSIPGVFVPHPSSPVPGSTNHRGREPGSPPPGADHGWAAAKDAALLASAGHQLFPRADPYRMAGSHDRQFTVLGMKRPPEDHDSPLLGFSSGGRDFPFLLQAAAHNFNNGGSALFDRQPESPSPPKALNTGQLSPSSISLLPSMSSLHNLLSKLPSVTALDSDASSLPPPHSHCNSSPSRNHMSLQQQPDVPLLRQPIISPTTSTDSPSIAGGMPADVDPNASPGASPPPAGGGARIHHPCGSAAGLAHLAGASPEPSPGEHDGATAAARDGVASTSSSSGSKQQSQAWPEQQQQRSSSEQCGSSCSTVGGPSRDHHQHHQPDKDAMGPATTNDKLTSFLDSFDQDSLTDLGLHEDLENSETYNSFLSEII